MDAVQIKGHFARLREIDTEDSLQSEQEATRLIYNLAENFFLEQKRQTELLEQIANTAEFFENQRREGQG